MSSKNFTTFEMSGMINTIKQYGVQIVFVDELNEVIFVEANGISGSLSFKDFIVDFDIFLDTCLMLSESAHKIEFKMEDLKQAKLNPQCTCGGKVTCNYDGEYTENYYFTCECGATETLNGYWLDSLIEE